MRCRWGVPLRDYTEFGDESGLPGGGSIEGVEAASGLW